MKVMTRDEYLDVCRAQEVLYPKHYAFICPICGTVQSMSDFLKAGLGIEEAAKRIGFSCIGRLTNAGPHKKGEAPGRGCNWSLGGLFQCHKLEVEWDGERFPRFEVATPEQAQEHMRNNTGEKEA